MYTKYYTIEIPDTKKMQAERKRRRILRRRIRTACNIAELLSLFCLFGIIGNLECSTMTIKQAIIPSIITIIIMAVSIKISKNYNGRNINE